nr:hypothetical protein CFP56_00467 [Quercus suber]
MTTSNTTFIADFFGFGDKAKAADTQFWSWLSSLDNSRDHVGAYRLCDIADDAAQEYACQAWRYSQPMLCRPILSSRPLDLFGEDHAPKSAHNPIPRSFVLIWLVPWADRIIDPNTICFVCTPCSPHVFASSPTSDRRRRAQGSALPKIGKPKPGDTVEMCKFDVFLFIFKDILRSWSFHAKTSLVTLPGILQSDYSAGLGDPGYGAPDPKWRLAVFSSGSELSDMMIVRAARRSKSSLPPASHMSRGEYRIDFIIGALRSPGK